MTLVPPLVERIEAIGQRAGWRLSSESMTGRLLRTLAATKPGGRFLEVGAGIGVGSAWLLDGMDETSALTTLEVAPNVAAVCRDLLKHDSRVTVVTTDAGAWLEAYDGEPFDFAFVDTTVTKFDRRDLVLRHLRDGALFVADDLLPQEKWTEAHHPRVERFRREIMEEPDLVPTLVDWASGLVIAAHRRSS
ncbi:O-methyltransferase [Paractinoplanes ovalisporus]|uniref:O-methyltransferase n=1 Tax=Paractinoplanes ovalisporus TaxID=2810368 RepID=UPI001F3EC02D|nr:class I SAM-dependent methyltransferase [Actinoplanes ovalisporus]